MIRKDRMKINDYFIIFEDGMESIWVECRGCFVMHEKADSEMGKLLLAIREATQAQMDWDMAQKCRDSYPVPVRVPLVSPIPPYRFDLSHLAPPELEYLECVLRKA